MSEHRTIERMINPINKQSSTIGSANKVNTEFISVTVDFIRTYADHCHHGKEEGILFRELFKKKLSPEHDATMKELIQEHIYARTTTRNLEEAMKDYTNGNTEALNQVRKFLNDLAVFYPKHIEKEDTTFFLPSMQYFTPEEQDAMLKEFWDFDKNLIHQKYSKVADKMESLMSSPP
ncbi:cation-binding protein [Candidatus Bathyarchaeota archaeon A05DMB-2]|jgi:hemerythrin-like domain-containing protein|nr:cation-binding protein [Candidatus Bathyarchaeota archaeon A05DMB-2]